MRYTVRMRNENALDPNAEWHSEYVEADDIEQAITIALSHFGGGRVYCGTYPGHDGYYSPDERLDGRTVDAAEWMAAHHDDERIYLRRCREQEAREQAEHDAALDAEYHRRDIAEGLISG